MKSKPKKYEFVSMVTEDGKPVLIYLDPKTGEMLYPKDMVLHGPVGEEA